MEVLEAIFTRRSVRNFTGQPISEEDLKTVVNAGFCAPSAHNKQPWHFVIVRDKDALENISKVHPYAKMLPQAGCGIIVCGDKRKEGMTGFLIEDCSAAIQNMLLAAHGLGLGAVWCGLYPVPQLTKPVIKFVNLPSAIVPVGMVVIGHKAEEKESIDRYDDSKVHIEQW
jgi:nitroreductase